jgi:hypothetical protein
VRINPFELHISDPDFYQEIYAGNTRKRDKYPWHVDNPEFKHAIGFTINHDLHRTRREALNPYFSKASVVKLEELIQSNVEKLCERIEEYLPIHDKNSDSAVDKKPIESETHPNAGLPVNMTLAWILCRITASAKTLALWRVATSMHGGGIQWSAS